MKMGQKVKNILRIHSSRTFAYKVKNTHIHHEVCIFIFIIIPYRTY